MNKLRVNTGKVVIEVNDQGETIELNFEDQEFPVKVAKLIENFEDKKAELETIYNTLDLSDDITAGVLDPKVVKFSEISLDAHKYFKEKIDNVFGKETCRKVFGDIVPSMEHISSFIEQLTPYFDEHKKSVQAKFDKYNAGRVGNV